MYVYVLTCSIERAMFAMLLSLQASMGGGSGIELVSTLAGREATTSANSEISSRHISIDDMSVP